MAQLVAPACAGVAIAAHRHSGPVFGYIPEGMMLLELEGARPREIGAGQSFWEQWGGAPQSVGVARPDLFLVLENEGAEKFLTSRHRLLEAVYAEIDAAAGTQRRCRAGEFGWYRR
jgi:hypothetical protein